MRVADGRIKNFIKLNTIFNTCFFNINKDTDLFICLYIIFESVNVFMFYGVYITPKRKFIYLIFPFYLYVKLNE